MLAVILFAALTIIAMLVRNGDSGSIQRDIQPSGTSGSATDKSGLLAAQNGAAIPPAPAIPTVVAPSYTELPSTAPIATAPIPRASHGERQAKEHRLAPAEAHRPPATSETAPSEVPMLGQWARAIDVDFAESQSVGAAFHRHIVVSIDGSNKLIVSSRNTYDNHQTDGPDELRVPLSELNGRFVISFQDSTGVYMLQMYSDSQSVYNTIMKYNQGSILIFFSDRTSAQKAAQNIVELARFARSGHP